MNNNATVYKYMYTYAAEDYAGDKSAVILARFQHY